MGCEGCAKFILIAFNIVFFLVGAAALGVGIWVLVDGTIFFDLLGKVPDSEAIGNLIGQAAYILIAAGGAIFLISFLGCCGAWKKNKCLLVTYSIIIGVLLALEIGCVVVAAVFSDQAIALVKDNLSKALGSPAYNSTFTQDTTDPKKISYKSTDLLSKGIDILQIQFECCGINNVTDFNGLAPSSCCPTEQTGDDLKTIIDKMWADGGGSFTLKDATCYNNLASMSSRKGCYQSLYDYVSEKSVIFIGIGAGTVAIQLVLIILSCCVCCSAGKDD